MFFVDGEAEVEAGSVLSVVLVVVAGAVFVENEGSPVFDGLVFD